MGAFGTWLTDRRRRRFCIAFVVTLFVATFFPIAVYLQIPQQATHVLITNLNYSVFYPVFLPLAAGVLAYSINVDELSRLAVGWKLFFLLLFLFVPLVVALDAFDKGPPIQPEEFACSESDRMKIIKCDNDARVITTTNAVERLNFYVIGVTNILKVGPNDVVRFSGFRDFVKRGSLVAFIDFFQSTFAGCIDAFFFIYLLFVRYKSVQVQDRDRDRLLLVVFLLISWFPFRILALWNQNFYSLENIGWSVPVLAILSASVISLLILLYKPGPVLKWICGIQSCGTIAIAVLAKVKPEIIAPIWIEIVGFPIEILITVEAIAFLTLVAIVLSYLDKPTDGSSPAPVVVNPS